MPTYEYECTKCGCVFEEFQAITEKAKRYIATNCTDCNNRAPVKRLIGTGAGLIFKGSGFYQTDYRSESYKQAAKAESEASSGSAKSDGESGKSKSETAKTSSDAATKDAAKGKTAKPAASEGPKRRKK